MKAQYLDVNYYYQLSEIANDCWWEEDLQSGQLKNSQQFIEMLGFGDEMLECPVSTRTELIHPVDRARTEAARDFAIKKGVVFKEAYRIRHAKGHYIWVGDHGRVVARDGQGNPTHMVGVCSDITVRKEAEIALKESESRYSLIAEIAQEAWWEEDVHVEEITNSPRFCEMLKIDSAYRHCTLSVFQKLIHPDDREYVRAVHDRVVSKDVNYNATFRLRHADGHYIWVESRARAVGRDSSGRTTRLLGAITDITPRKLAEIELQESKENFHRLFDEAPDAYMIVSQDDLSVLTCNKAVEYMFGGTRDQIIGMTPDQLSPPIQPGGKSTQVYVMEKLNLALEMGYSRFESVYRRFDGNDFWVEVTTRTGTYNHLPVFYATWREIGEVIAARQAAEAANVAKDQFLSVMSHELRTPLTTVMGILQLIQSSGDGDRMRKYASKGLESADHLLHLVNDILDFSSIEMGKTNIALASFDLSELLDELSSLSFGKQGSSVQFGVKLDKALEATQFIGDATRLKQVLINLVSNALKFTHSGSIVLSVRHVGGKAGSPKLEFSVVDTGIGMTVNQMDRLFQPFTQLDMSDQRRYGGTGLGLAISQRLVGLMGGEPITVSSQPGSGSSFTFRIVLPLAVSTTGRVVSASGSPPTAKTGHLAGYRLLLVEDNDDIRAVTRLLLEAEGATVEEAIDGEKGMHLAQMAAVPHDAVLMDMRMPVMDGVETTREMRARGYTRPIIALTANAFSREVEACLAAGMNACLTKPMKINDLIDLLRRHCV